MDSHIDEDFAKMSSDRFNEYMNKCLKERFTDGFLRALQPQARKGVNPTTENYGKTMSDILEDYWLDTKETEMVENAMEGINTIDDDGGKMRLVTRLNGKEARVTFFDMQTREQFILVGSDRLLETPDTFHSDLTEYLLQYAENKFIQFRKRNWDIEMDKSDLRILWDKLIEMGFHVHE